MALFTVSIDSVAGGNSTFTGIPGRKMFNTTRVSELYEFGASDSAFEYSLEWDGDVQTSVCIADDTVATILNYFESTWNPGAIPLTSYPFGDLDRTETVFLDPHLILFGAEFSNRGFTKLILTHTRQLWVSETIDEILALAVASSTGALEWDDGVSYFRLIIRDEELCLDSTIAPAVDFTGAEDVGWGNIFEKSDND